jgi:uncharacterized membrane protein (UPF0127 family)
MSFPFRPVLASLVAMLMLAGCPKFSDSVELKGQRFNVELATDDATRARGLMFRESLAPNAGMLFIFDDEQPRAFWMHNCKIALDILYFDSDLKLVSSALSVPPCSLAPAQCPSYASEGPAKYVLELAAGRATEIGAVPGDKLSVDLQ